MFGTLGGPRPTAVDVDRVHGLIALITDPEGAKKRLAELQAVLAQLGDVQAATEEAAKKADERNKTAAEVLARVDALNTTTAELIEKQQKEAASLVANYAELSAAESSLSAREKVLRENVAKEAAIIAAKKEEVAMREAEAVQAFERAVALKQELDGAAALDKEYQEKRAQLRAVPE